MKPLLLFCLSLGFSFGLVFIYFSQKSVSPVIQTPVSPTPTPYKFSLSEPPKNSLIGTIASASGEILWQSRIATQEAALGELTQIKQGESLTTGPDSGLTVTFPDAAFLKIDPDTHIIFAQTLPQNLLFSQTLGRVTYRTSGTDPVSVRALHLLVNLTAADLVVTVVAQSELVYLDLYSGSVTLAFNNIHAVTQNITLDPGRRIVYNDETRKITFKTLPPAD